jgi:hypothetical protein
MIDSYSGTGFSFIQLFVTGGGGPNFNWHYVAVPVDGLSTSIFTSVPSLDLLAYNDSRVVTSLYNGWSYFDGYGGTPGIAAGGGFATLSFGQGYNFYTSSDATIVFPLMPSLGTTLGSVALQYSGSAPADPLFGYNLLGNSLTCSLDWNKVTFSGSVGSTVYYTTGNQWATFLQNAGGTNGGTKDIPPLQGFFVKADATGGSVDLSAAKEHSSQARYKKSLSVEQASSQEEVIYPKVKLQLNGAGTSDETIIWFNDAATTGYDEKYDGYKLFSSQAGTGQLYSTIDGKEYVINGIPLPADSYIVPLVVKIAQTGNYSLLKKDFLSPDGYDILLIDKANNNFTVNLKNTDVYSFSSDAGTFTNRFILEIKSLSTVTKVEDRETSGNYFNIYSYHSNVNIIPLNSLLSGSKGEIKISDLTGRVVKEVKNVEWHEGSLVEIPCDLQKGIYIVEASSGALRQIGKIILQ